MTSDTKILQRLLDPSLGGTKLELKHGELMPLSIMPTRSPTLRAQMFGRALRAGKTVIYPTLEFDYAKLEQRFAAYVHDWVDEPVPGKIATWRRVPRQFVDVFEPANRGHELHPPEPISFRVSAELVNLVSPPPPWPPPGYILIDGLIR